jgi:small GTP-binding protein
MEYTFKVILLGDSLVGKSSLMGLLKDQVFVSSYSSTIGVDFGTVRFEHGDDKIKIQIWDTGGQEKFSPLVKVYYRNSTCAIVMFDLTNRGSFTRVSRWIDEFKHFTSGHRPIIVVGNKSDLFNMRVLTKKEIKEEVTDKLDLPYFEISVKDDANVTELFDYIINEIKRLVKIGLIEPSPINGLKIQVPKKSFMLHSDFQGSGTKENEKKCCSIM